MVLFIIVIIVFVIQGVFWGITTNRVMYNKGYCDDWFWKGFFFSGAAFAAALSKPAKDNGTYQEDILLEKIHKEDLLNNDGWECPFCHSLNGSIVSTCGCGKSREYGMEYIKQQNTSIPEQNTILLLKEYKELMDNGVITQEEFDIKKRKLLKNNG
ncbi:MAG: SHOCT domain-containing protein [Lachnospiraceae bacterium]|nr:SHOCT domain-containing protein [Lachnospiraceae bacterium]